MSLIIELIACTLVLIAWTNLLCGNNLFAAFVGALAVAIASIAPWLPT